MPHNPLSIVETSRFVEALRQLKLTDRQADELLRGVLFVIARDPREGVRIAASSRVWAIPFEDPSTKEDSYVLYYAFNKESIYLLALRPVQDS